MNTVTYISLALGFPVKFQNIYGTIIDKSYFFSFVRWLVWITEDEGLDQYFT